MNTIKIVVLSVNEERRKYMEKQLQDLKVLDDVDYFKGFTPSESTEYMDYRDEKVPEYDTTLCCFRSYTAVFDKYKNLNYEYIIILEDDIVIHKDFKNKIENIIKTWEKYPQTEYISLGYILSFCYDTIKFFKNDNDLYYDMSTFSEVWGAQMTMFNKKTINKLSVLYKPSAKEVRKFIDNISETYSNRYVRLQTDSILPYLCKQGMVYPPLAFENPNIVSTITNIANSHNNSYFKKHYLIDYSEYHNSNMKNSLFNSSKTVGITMLIPDNSEYKIYTNLEVQKVLSLYEVFNLLKFNVYIITDKELPKDSINIKQYNNVIYNDKINHINFDVIIQFNFKLDVSSLENLKKNTSCKIIEYIYKNDYIKDLQYSFLPKNTGFSPVWFKYRDKNVIDEVWCVDSISKDNLHYLKIFYSCDIITVPDIWSNYFIENMYKDYSIPNNGLCLDSNKLLKSIVIFDENSNIIMSNLPSILLSETLYNKKKIIKHLYIGNVIDSEFNSINSVNIITNLKMFKANKISIEKYFPSLIFLSKYADILVSNDIEGSINYRTLELAWMGWPVLHNNDLYKDIGYYYDKYKYEEGSNTLMNIILSHDKIIHNYMLKNRHLIERYIPNNKVNLEKYKYHIEKICTSSV